MQYNNLDDCGEMVIMENCVHCTVHIQLKEDWERASEKNERMKD